ncbi:MAG: TIGR01620 family protein [Hyphomicrobiales bacterium]|nr:TIGR01620 family protein [Hyphomicrobiales bacterium]
MVSHRPRAFRLREVEDRPSSLEEAATSRGALAITPDRSLEPALAEDHPSEEAANLGPGRQRRLMKLGGLLAASLSGLVLIGLSTVIERSIASLIEENAWLGGVAAVLAGLAALALLGLLGREAISIWRQRRITALREEATKLRDSRDVAKAAAFVATLARLYAHRPETARARALLAGIERDVLDPADRLAVAERELILPLDIEARRLVAASAQRVSIVTALAPRALFDVLFVAGQSIWLIRRVSEIYGSRPGLLGFLALMRRVLSYLAITGGMAVGDSLVQQVLGHGIASRLSAKLGEGVLNGLLTARVGLATIQACRPLPFAAVAPPKLADVAGALIRKASVKDEGRSKRDPH